MLKAVQRKIILSATDDDTPQSGKRKSQSCRKRLTSTTKRLRSRNSYIDECLREENGADTFADLEDFIEI